MTITIGNDPKIRIRSSSATPGIAVATINAPSGAPVVIWHLTNNFVNGPDPRASSSDAWTATGTVSLQFSTATDPFTLPQWNFGFIQFMRVNQVQCSYTGLKPNDGSITIDFMKPPAIAKTLLLDSFSATIPWTKATTGGGQTAKVPVSGVSPTATTTTGDQTMSRVVAMLNNDNNAAPNYLSLAVDDRDFWTVFTARDPNQKLTYLAHFHGKVRWEIKFVWRNALPVGTVQQASSLTFDPVVNGAPTDPALATLLTNPTGPMCNDQYATAMVQAPTNFGSNRKDNSTWLGPIPNFWR